MAARWRAWDILTVRSPSLCRHLRRTFGGTPIASRRDAGFWRNALVVGATPRRPHDDRSLATASNARFSERSGDLDDAGGGMGMGADGYDDVPPPSDGDYGDWGSSSSAEGVAAIGGDDATDAAAGAASGAADGDAAAPAAMASSTAGDGRRVARRAARPQSPFLVGLRKNLSFVFNFIALFCFVSAMMQVGRSFGRSSLSS